MMKGDLHYEVVVDPTGRQHRLYFSDAVREELPAATASNASLIVHRPQQADERITLAIDETGESWIGKGGAVAPGAGVSVTVSFTIHGEAYSIDLAVASS